LMAWWERAKCKGEPTEWWYNPDMPHDPRAMSRCAECPVIDECWEECRSHELSWRYGIWAGTTPNQREEWGRYREGRPASRWKRRP